MNVELQAIDSLGLGNIDSSHGYNRAIKYSVKWILKNEATASASSTAGTRNQRSAFSPVDREPLKSALTTSVNPIGSVASPGGDCANPIP